MKKEIKATFNEKEFELYKKIKDYQEEARVSESDFVKIALVQLTISFSDDDGKVSIKSVSDGIKGIKRATQFWKLCGFKEKVDNSFLDFLDHKNIELKKEVKKE